jgi:hypothetical protein
MTNVERARLNLYERLSDTFDPPNADTLMELLPPVGWADVATKADVNHCRDVLGIEIRSFESKLDDQIGQVRGEMSAFRTEIITEMDRRHTELLLRMGAQDQRLDALTIKLQGASTPASANASTPSTRTSANASTRSTPASANASTP